MDCISLEAVHLDLHRPLHEPSKPVIAGSAGAITGPEITTWVTSDPKMSSGAASNESALITTGPIWSSRTGRVTDPMEAMSKTSSRPSMDSLPSDAVSNTRP